MSKLNFVNTILGKEDDEYVVDYDLSIIKTADGEKLDIWINTVNGDIPIECTATVRDISAIYTWIENNHNVGEISDEIKTQQTQI